MKKKPYGILLWQPELINPRAMGIDQIIPGETEGVMHLEENFGESAFQAGKSKEFQRRCKQATRETERTRNVPREGRGALQSR